MASPKWIRELNKDEEDNTEFLLGLYKVYQDRLLSDLRLLFSYTNFYAAAFLALFTAFVVALVKYKDDPMVAWLTLLPLASHIWICNGRTTAWLFYRRYTEGRVLLMKIEYALGLDREIPIKNFKGKAPFVWDQEESFLPSRYFTDARGFDNSAHFTQDRSINYGLGKVTKLMFRALLIFAWVGLFVTPAYLYFFSESDPRLCVSVVISVFAAMLAGIVWLFYEEVLKDEGYAG